MSERTATNGTRGDWEDLGRIDAEWSILSEPGKRFGGWDELDFFASGRVEVGAILEHANTLGVLAARRRALDVGCGIGRLSAALAEHFDDIVAIDISEAMLRRARELHGSNESIRFIRRPADDLSGLDDESFDFVLTRLVLQHLPSEDSILRALAEMLRVLRPGGLLVAQSTSKLPLRHRLQPRARMYRALRGAGIPADVLYRRFHLQPIRMTVAQEAAVLQLFKEHGATLRDAKREAKNAGAVWTTYWVTR